MILGIFALALALLFGIYLFLMMPRVGNRADTELLLGNYAHRGLWDETIPENSLAAFARAVSLGYGIELDVRLSRDRRVMVFHDEDLARMCGVKGKISDYTFTELRRLRLKGSEQMIPTLDEVLALVRGRVPLMIEIKGADASPNAALCVRVAHRLDTYAGAFSVISFNPLVLSWFKNYRPSFARGQLVTKSRNHKKKGSRAISLALFLMFFNFVSRPDFLSVKFVYQRRPDLLLCQRLFHTPVFLWTIRQKGDYLACRKHGFYAVFERIRPNLHERKSSL